MGILKILLDEIKTPNADLTQQVRELCDQIMEQELPTMKYSAIAPQGSVVFLSIEAPGRYIWEIGFLTLEREDVETYTAVYHTIEKSRVNLENIEESIPPRRRKVWIINENKADKILTQFASKLKMLRGE